MATILENYTLICDRCHKKITTNRWYRFKYNDYKDFCSTECAVKEREIAAPIVDYSPLDEQYRVMGNTD